MYLDFALLASDQIVNQAAKVRYMTGGQVSVPLVIRTQGGGYKSSAAQHGQSLEAWFAHIPGLLVALPADAADAKGLLKTAIRLSDPVLFIEHKSLYVEIGEIPEGEHLVPFGQAALKRKGADVTIVAWSKMVGLSLQAAELLAGEHRIDAAVIDLRTLVPLDRKAILQSVASTKRAVVVHEAHRFGGFGAEIASSINEELFDTLEAPVARVGARHVPLPMAPNLEQYVLPSVDRIVAAVLVTLGGRPRAFVET
jgi:pyruvate dehydrogenase E1 component beta subunit